MYTSQLSEDTLRALSEVEADEPVVISLFLDLDPAQFATPPARTSQITSLLSELDALLRDAGLSQDAADALKVDRERIEVSCATMTSMWMAWRAWPSTRPMRSRCSRRSSCPTRSNRRCTWNSGRSSSLSWVCRTRRVVRAPRHARLGAPLPTGIREIRDVQSDVKNPHSAGGWSQARFERSIGQEVEWHLERATDLLFRHFKRRPFDHLIVGANNEALRPALSGETHAYLTERIRGWVDIDEKLASESQVFEAVREVMDAHLEQAERALLERFAAEKATDGRAAEGIDPVLAALAERRVETLVVRQGAAAPGTKCVTCGWLGPAGIRRCPVDQTTLDAVNNVVEPAIQVAIQQSATVHVLRPPAGEENAEPISEPIAALLRY